MKEKLIFFYLLGKMENLKFISLGQNSISFKVIREIKCGEEITVYYGKHYFGENNCECRCVTCEK
jgi:SET domain-containing protein